ncbi:MAG: RNA polymerase sigma24 factor [Candidatus Hydrogenedentota bacterium]
MDSAYPIEERPHGDSDETLMAAARDGDMEAFGRLVRRYEAPLFTYLRRMTGNAAEAEDVFQETMLRLYRSRDRYDPSSPLRPWLYRIATNCSCDRLRYLRRRLAVSLDRFGGAESDGPPLAERIPDAHASADASARESELRERLEAAIARLPMRHRAVFLMARHEGMPYDAIGECLGIPVGTVKSRMNKAVRLLMDELREFVE